MAKQPPSLPDWARRERLADMAWIAENLHVFWPVARQQYRARGRGAVVVDTTIVQEEGSGHPFTFLTADEVRATCDGDAQRMVREYTPEWELVVALLKSRERISVYRLRVLA